MDGFQRLAAVSSVLMPTQPEVTRWKRRDVIQEMAFLYVGPFYQIRGVTRLQIKSIMYKLCRIAGRQQQL